MMNECQLIGRLTADPELRYTQSGKAVCSVTVACDRGYGENKETDFIPVVLWEQRAEFAANYLAKGVLVGVVGRIQVRKYEASDGSKRTATEVVARELKSLSRPNNGNEEAQPAPAPASKPVAAAKKPAPAKKPAAPAAEPEAEEDWTSFSDPFEQV